MAEHIKTIIDPLFDIEGKVYLIAGACGGLASPLLEEISTRGVKMALYDKDEAGLIELKSKYPHTLVRAGSINCEKSVNACVDKIIEKHRK